MQHRPLDTWDLHMRDATVPKGVSLADMDTTQLIVEGRKKIKESDESLIRSEKLVAETIEIGTKTAAKLDDQTKQLERVVDDLDQIHFSMKKAQKIIRDITRGIATDKSVFCFHILALRCLKIWIHGADRQTVISSMHPPNLCKQHCMCAMHTSSASMQSPACQSLPVLLLLQSFTAHVKCFLQGGPLWHCVLYTALRLV